MPRFDPLPTYPRGTVLLRTRYDQNFIADLKQLPGCRFAPDLEAGSWLVPEDLMGVIGARARHYHLPHAFSRSWAKFSNDAAALRFAQGPHFAEARPWQKDAVARISKFGSQLLHHPLGTGKTATTLFALEALGVENALITCPAMVRSGWRDAARQFKVALEPQILESSADFKKGFNPKKPGIIVTSYELATKHREMAELPWQALVIDECHYIKEAKAGRSRAILEVSQKMPVDAIRIGPSATPIALEPRDLWHQLAVLNPGINGSPGKWGTWWQFVNRYSNVSHNGYGHDVVGLNEENVAELQERLALAVHTVTDAEVAPYMPPYTVQSLRFKAKDPDLRALSRDWLKSRDRLASAEKIIRAAYLQKALLAAEMAEDALATTPRVAVLTYFHETADAIMEVLHTRHDLKNVPLFRIPSDGTPSKRLAAIDKACAAQRCIAVMTMKSIGVGINNLQHFKHAIFAELYPAQETMLQALGRFPRMGGVGASLITLLLLEGTIDEPIAAVLTRRTAAVNEVFAQGGAADKLSDAISPKLSEEDFMKGIIDAAMSMVEV